MAATATRNAEGSRVGVVKLGWQGLSVSAQGFGCAGLTGRYGPMKAEDELISLIHHAVSRGVTFLDTSDAYGPFISEIIVGKALKGIRRQVQLATKFGGRHFLDGKSEIRGDPAHIRASCEASLNRLGVDCIDLYYQHRVDTKVPIEVTVGEMKKLVEEGKVKFIGLSEPSAETIRRAHAVHPVTAVQIEWSLWNRSAEQEIIPTCRELGIGIVAYSPLGRGFLASGPKIVQTFADTDVRKTMKRFQVGNLEKNKEAFEGFCGIARRKGCTPAQLALAWLHSRGKDVVPIPGTSKIKSLDENIDALSVTVEDTDLMEIESTMASASTGETDLDLENLRVWKFANTPPLSSYKNTTSC